MSITVIPVDHGDLCHGWRWKIDDEDDLAERVARVAMGQYRHVAHIIAGATNGVPKATDEQAADAIQLLTVKPGDDAWHRDGWIFQTISWIAAHRTAHGAITRPPHILKAHKGFDGMQLELSADGKSVVAVIIFEDKATGNARKTIREEVWPAIGVLESGKRVSELTHETSAMLEAQQAYNPGLNVDEAISNIIWKEARRYRVSITVEDTHEKDASRKKLFKEFDAIAPGAVHRRRADTMYVPELRKWMEAFAQKAIKHVSQLALHV